MRTLKLTIAYDGTRYAGWQRQDHARPQKRATIQATLEEAVQQIVREPIRLKASGRTDTGVHAIGQVAHFKTASPIPCERLLRAVNHVLPDDIAVTRIEAVAAAFHAQYDAAGKHYRYRIFTGSATSPFIRRWVHQVRNSLNVALMRREIASIKGKHDFAAFTKAGHRSNKTVRAISRASLTRHGEELHFDIEGSGFLYTMVRSIVGTLIDIGRGRRKPGTFKQMIATKKRTLAGTTAPAQGLTLISVTYPRLRKKIYRRG